MSKENQPQIEGIQHYELIGDIYVDEDDADISYFMFDLRYTPSGGIEQRLKLEASDDEEAKLEAANILGREGEAAEQLAKQLVIAWQ